MICAIMHPSKMRNMIFPRLLLNSCLRPFCSNSHLTRSPLFVSDGHVVDESVLIPDVDINATLDAPGFEQSLKKREFPYHENDLEQMKRVEKDIKLVDEEYEKNNLYQQELSLQLKGIIDKGDDGQGIEKIKCQLSQHKIASKDLKAQKVKLRHSTLLSFLSLPNQVSEDCPADSKLQLLHQAHSRPEFQFPAKGHMELAKKDLHVDGVNGVYLFDRLARLELKLPRTFQSHFYENKFSMLSGPDFAKSMVVDGNGDNFLDPKATFALKEIGEFKDRTTGHGMHLVGSASIYPFLSFFSKNIILQPKKLPYGFFSIGRTYKPCQGDENAGSSLFNTKQTTSVHCFKLGLDLKQDFDNLVRVVRGFYDSLGVHYRLRVNSAPELRRNEHYRLSVEMYSPHLKDYLEVGHVSNYSDYLSKRLMFKGQVEKDKFINLMIMGGQVMDVIKVIGCMVECNQTIDGDFVV